MSPKTEKLIRTSMGFRKEVIPVLNETYASPLIERIKENKFRIEAGRITIYLAEEFGFCYGVDRAIILAYETRKMFPTKRIFLTSEIIHNPQVNAKLKEKGISFLTDPEFRDLGYEAIQKEDVVIIPAFGTTTDDLIKLQAKGCALVDTTCGSVMNVWKRVDSYARDGFTSVIHGKYDHEETRATSSRAHILGGKYLIVRDLKETEVLCDYIRGNIPSPLSFPLKGEGRVKGIKEKFFQLFSKEGMSAGFDPARDLVKIGCANQTTMLSSESMKIADMIQDAMRVCYGEKTISEHFRHFDTICSATQDRQDAIIKLVKQGIDLAVIVGGYNSSNTGHLVEIASEFCTAFHINDASEILSTDEICHQPPFKKETVTTRNWLPQGPVKIGVTAGASTPNRVIEDVIRRLLAVADCSLPQVNSAP